jgi:hypothetical protein
MRGGTGGILGGKYANGDFGNAPTQDASYGRGIYHDAKHFLTEGTTNKNKKTSKSAGIIFLNGTDAIYNTGVQDMPEKFSHLNDGRAGYTEGFGISGGKFSFKKMGERVDNGENVFTDYGKSKQGKANNKATVNALKTGGVALAIGVGIKKPEGILSTTKNPRGLGLVKGSQAAKDHMAAIRAKRVKK